MKTKVIVVVQGGIVQNIFANGDVDVDVFDLDVSDFPDEGEQEAVDKKEDEVEKIISQKGCWSVW